MIANEPAEIELDPLKELRIRWYDGHESVYPLNMLRKLCPCALCKAGAEEEGNAGKTFKVLSGPIVKTAQAIHLETVGHYAIRISWNDGHNAGLYTYEYLRNICPCETCKKKD